MAPPVTSKPTLTVTSVTNANTFSTPRNQMNFAVIPELRRTPPKDFLFRQIAVGGFMSNLLLRIDKGSHRFWVGVAVPQKTIDFTKAHIYFHPTVKQKEVIIADDRDYPTFTGGWSDTMQRYTKITGGQLAASGALVPLIAPFTTMGALHTNTLNMFNDGAVDLLNAILATTQDVTTKTTGNHPILQKIGVSSFSSGIYALNFFLARTGGSKLIAEINDFDGPFITGNASKSIPQAVGAASRVFTQEISTPPKPGWVTVLKENLATVNEHLDRPEPRRTHARIGWMMYYQAMMTSAVR